jgi:hypothetical protein
MRPPPGPTPEVLRELAQAAVSRSSLREVARDIGMAPSNLLKFLGGSVPRRSTRQKLLEWHVREAGRVLDLPPETVEAGLDLLLAGLAGERREQVRGSIVTLIEAAHREQRTLPPEWIRRLREDDE